MHILTTIEVYTLNGLIIWYMNGISIKLGGFLLKILSIRERHRERERQREKQAPCREPNVGLDPGSPGSGSGPKAGAKPLSHPGVPKLVLNKMYTLGFVLFT